VTILAIEINDRALALASQGRVLSSAPSVVFDGSGTEPAGSLAWQEFRRQPTKTSSRHLHDLARKDLYTERALAIFSAELRQRLQAHPPAADARIWLAAPAQFEARGLGTVLGLAQKLSVQVDGCVDAAVASVAGLGIERSALVVELGLHHVAATAVDGGSVARRRRAVVSERGGLIELYEAWLDLISTAMVKRTRFDPLHDAATEQQLFDAVPGLARQVASTGSAVAVVNTGNESFDTTLTRDQFVNAGQAVYREVMRVLHELRPAGAPVTLVMPRAAAELPGLREAFEQFAGCDLVALADGFAAMATSLFELPASSSGETVPLLRRIPTRTIAASGAMVTRIQLGSVEARSAEASHVLYAGKAFSLGRDAIVVGRAPGGANAIVLPEGLAGVSRRHCTFVRDGGETMLVDHSSYGTFVNGERVSERVRVHAGDRVRIGEPGVELSLIAVGASGAESHGASA
jgi:hypothetical protein